MARPFFKVVDDLPSMGLTAGLLGALDWVTPGEYTNITSFEGMVKDVTKSTDEKFIQQVGERAIFLFNDSSQGYQRALWLYQTIDSTQGVAGFASFLSKMAENFSFLSFLNNVTPKADTTQAVDLGLKLVAEIVAFCSLNGLPGDSIGDFVESLADYRHEALMRMTALVCVDGVLPLGPDFVSKAMGMLDSSGMTELAGNERFQRVSGMIPGDSTKEQLGFMKEGLGSIKDWAGNFVAKHSITVEKVAGSLKGVSDRWEGSMDWMASVIDMTTDYYEHTGVQTVARQLISRAAAEV
ncbi:hypothetical protein Pan97_29810 [Bremerella volcania]|uniref:Uncharacterized protein n=1 Tax=Bremerella volcania TaxID=2527984 RepID=A0A518C9M6_9BACT|nr:hypothetical protein [Bremerella volcania]QDU75937.1 hypothetical protein Pan97_29810 [Bremerella volcania]